MDVFISHNSKDADLASALIDTLRSALSIPAAAIRCTSVDGYRLPGGADFNSTLRKEVSESKVFIALITPDGLKSRYMILELGARWGIDKPLVPLIARDAKPGDIGGFLSGLNALNLTVEAQAYQMVGDIGSLLSAPVATPNVYMKHVATLVKLAKKANPSSVSSAPTPRSNPPPTTGTSPPLASFSPANTPQPSVLDLLKPGSDALAQALAAKRDGRRVTSVGRRQVLVPDIAIRFEPDGTIVIPNWGIIDAMDGDKLRAARKPFTAECTDVSGAAAQTTVFRVVRINPG